MATQDGEDFLDVLDDTEEGAEAEAEQADGDEAGEEDAGDDDEEASEEAGAEEGDGGEAADDTGEVVVTIGDEEPPEDAGKAPDWVRDLRRQNRELIRKQRELEAQLATAKPQPAEVTVGTKPTLESCGFDADKFASDLEAWHERKRQADLRDAERKAADERAKAAWNERMSAYGAAKTKLRVTDFEDAEASALDALSVVQQGIVINAANNPALVMYALGKNHRKAKEVAAITDPVRFTYAVATLEAQLKVTPKTKAAPAPERKLTRNTGGAAANLAANSRLDNLQREAQRTGNYTKFFAAKRAMKGKTA